MQLAQNESPAQTNRQRCAPLRDELSKACEVCGNTLIRVCNSKENYRVNERKCKTAMMIRRLSVWGTLPSSFFYLDSTLRLPTFLAPLREMYFTNIGFHAKAQRGSKVAK